MSLLSVAPHTSVCIQYGTPYPPKLATCDQRSNGSNLYSNGSNLYSNGSNLYSNGLNFYSNG